MSSTRAVDVEVARKIAFGPRRDCCRRSRRELDGEGRLAGSERSEGELALVQGELGAAFDLVGVGAGFEGEVGRAGAGEVGLVVGVGVTGGDGGAHGVPQVDAGGDGFTRGVVEDGESDVLGARGGGGEDDQQKCAHRCRS